MVILYRLRKRRAAKAAAALEPVYAAKTK
jgi:hypothetical protein